MADDHFLEDVRERARAGLDVVRDAAQPPAEIAHDDGHDRDHDDRQQRQLPVDPDEVAEARDDRQRRAQRIGDRPRRGGRELMCVERDLRLQHAGRMRVVIGRGQAQQLGDQVAAKVEHHAIAGPSHPVLGNVRADATQQEHGDDGDGQPRRAQRIGALEIAYDRNHEIREEEIAGRDDDHPEHRDAEYPAVRPHVAQQAPIERGSLHCRRAAHARGGRCPVAGGGGVCKEGRGGARWGGILQTWGAAVTRL